MKKNVIIGLIMITSFLANAQTPVKKDSKPLFTGNGKVENAQVANKSSRWGKAANLSTTDLEKMFWADPQVKALTKVEANTNTQNNAAQRKKVKPFWEVGESYIILSIDPTSGTYISTDSTGNKTNWLAIRYRGIDENTKKPITLCMLKNVDKNLTTVWAEDGVNNFNVNRTGSKTAINTLKLGSNGTISFGQKSVADQDCSNVPCCRCFGTFCNPCATVFNNQTQN
jgi:hypothetical protein